MVRDEAAAAAAFREARQGDRRALAQLLSAVERGGPAAQAVGRLVAPHVGNAYTVGVTGTPGSGKSTLVDRLVTLLRDRNLSTAVLAVDPSSHRTGGALLGDRIRMEKHAADPEVFIRSMASRGALGGLACATPEAIRLLDAVGREWILVETVGVGQTEIDVAAAADTTVLVLAPGAGDGVQAEKAGVLEIADVVAVNKADRPGADVMCGQLVDAYAGRPHCDWSVPVVPTVAASGLVAPLWEAIERHRAHQMAGDGLTSRRRQRSASEVRRLVVALLGARLDAADDAVADAARRVTAGDSDVFTEATRLIRGASTPNLARGEPRRMIVTQRLQVRDEPARR